MTSVDRIQGLSGGLAVKAPVRAATTASITLSGLQTVDGVALAEGDRVLVKDQTATTENGIYDASTGSWQRSKDFDGANDFVQGTMVLVQQGDLYTNRVFAVSTASPSIGDALSFTSALEQSFLSTSGDAQSIYSVSTTGQFIDLRKGTSASPDTAAHPLIKATRTVNIPKPGVSDRGEEMAAIYGLSVGTTSNQAQTVGVYGGARSDYRVAPTNVEGDACGLYGVARTADYGTAIGIFATGRRDGANGKGTAAEFAVQNYGAAATWNTTGYSQATGVWLACLGDYDSAVGFNIGNPFGKQFEVGLGFTAQVAGGKTGGVSGYSIRDAGNATYSIKIEGTHTTALAIGATAGNLTIGQDGPASSGAKCFIKSTTDAMTPLIVRGNSATQSAHLFRVEDSAGNMLFQIQASGLAGFRSQDFIPRLLGSEMTTTSQSGFLHVPSSNGVHTGVPSSIVTGNVPIVYDSANNKLGSYNGAWRWTAAFT